MIKSALAPYVRHLVAFHGRAVNQFRLILHSAAYWLMLAMRKAVPKRSLLCRAEFATLRLHLVKIAARVVEGAARIRVSLPSDCPHAALFRQLAGYFVAVPP